MTAIRRPDLDRRLAQWDPALRLLLLAGPDEAASHDLAGRALKALSDPADPMSVTDIPADALKGDPGRLADEAASVSMFGGRRAIRVTGAGEGTAEAVRLLLEASAAGNPVVMQAGDLSKTSGLRRLAEESPAALILLSYPLNPNELGDWLRTESAARGLRPAAGVLQRLVAATGGDVGVLASELDKFALFLEADAAAPKALEPRHLDLLGADSAEEDLALLVAAVVAGKADAAERQYRLLAGTSAIPALRAVARRLMQMAELRQAVDRGQDPRSAVKTLRPPVFWREQDAMAAAVSQWPLPRIRRGLAAMLAGEQAIKQPGGPGDVAGWQAILALGRQLGNARESA